MPSLDVIKTYVDSVCRQIRWKKAHSRVCDELTHHIIDSRDSYITLGLDEAEATDKAMADTGDAANVGMLFDRIHRPKPQWVMLAWVAGLLLLGLFISHFVLGPFVIGDRTLSTRLFWTAAGFAVMLVMYFADFTLIGKYPRVISLAIILFAMVFIFFSPGGLIRFYHIQNIALMLPVPLAAVIYMTRNKGYKGIVLCSLTYGFLCLLTMTAVALSGFLHFVIIGAVILFVAVCRNWHGSGKIVSGLIVLVPPAAVAAALLATLGPGHRMTRITAFLNPHADPMGFGFLTLQTRRMLSESALIGQGAAADTFFLPQSLMHSDLMLALLTARFGWVAFAGVVGLLLVFIVGAVRRCVRQRSELGLLVSLTVIVTLSVQAVLFVVYNLGFMFTMISLPLLSPGNFAMVINMGLIGLMLSVFRTGDVVSDGDVKEGAVWLKL